MGQLIERLAPEYATSIITTINRADPFSENSIASADVVIDFSGPEHILQRIQCCGKTRVPMVIGTTGWDQEKAAAKEIVAQLQSAVIVSANFSMGIALFLQMVRQAAQQMNRWPHYDVAIQEQHHRQKKDHPSGTAKMIADVLIQELDRKEKTTSQLDADAVDPTSLHIASLRCGQVPGTHEVIFDGPDDTITLTHTARSRHDFARGALQAASWIIDKKGFFTAEDMLCK